MQRRSERENYREYIGENVHAKLRRLNTVRMSEAKTQQDLYRENVYVHGIEGFNENMSLREQIAKKPQGQIPGDAGVTFWETYNDACMLLSSPEKTSLEQIKTGTQAASFDADILTTLRQGITQGELLSAAEDQMVVILGKAGYTAQAFTRDVHLYKEKNGDVRVVIRSVALEVFNTANTEEVLTGKKREGFALRKTTAPVIELNLEFTLAPGCLTRGASNVHCTIAVNNSELEKKFKNAPAQLREDYAKAQIFRDQVIQDFRATIKKLKALPNADKFITIIDELERKLNAMNTKEYKTPLEVDQDISNMISAARISTRERFPAQTTPTTIVVPANQADPSTNDFLTLINDARHNELAKLKVIQEQPLSSLTVVAQLSSPAIEQGSQIPGEIDVMAMLGAQQAATVAPLSDQQKAAQLRDQIATNFSKAVRGYLSQKHEPTGIAKKLEHLVRDRERTQAKIELAEHLLAELQKLEQKDFSEPYKVMHAVLDLLVKYHTQNLHIEYGVKNADTSELSSSELNALNDAREAIDRHLFNYVTGNTFADMLNNMYETARENYQLTDKQTPISPMPIQEP